MSSNWAQTKSAAQGILGSKGKVPEPRMNVDKFWADFDKANADYGNAIRALQTKIVNLQNACSSVQHVLKQFQDQIDGNNFGLSAADGGADKAAKAQKVLDDYLDGQLKALDANIKNLDDLDKHTMAISQGHAKMQ